MKRLLLPLIAGLALPTFVNADISDKIHNRCKDVMDYIGCVKLIGGFIEASKEECDKNGWCIGGSEIGALGDIKIKGWKYLNSPEIRQTGYLDPIFRKVMSKGEYGRFYEARIIARILKNPSVDISGKVLSRNDEHESNTLDQGHRSSTLIQILERVPMPVGVFQGIVHFIVDCQKQRIITWETFEGKTIKSNWFSRKWIPISNKAKTLVEFENTCSTLLTLPESD